MKVLNSFKNKEKNKKFMKKKRCCICYKPVLFYDKHKKQQRCDRCQNAEHPLDKMFRGF